MKVDNDVLLVLTHAQCEGNALRLVGQLDRKLYERTNKVLEAAGGKWNRKAKAHLYEGDAAEAMEQIILTGECEINRKQNFGYFPTPLKLGLEVAELACIESGNAVLEPNIGQGHLAEAIQRVQPAASIKGYELLPENIAKVAGKYDATQADFLAVEIVPEFDRVVMNPPFAKQADIYHVQHALKFLKPGGRLVSIMSASVTFRDNKLTTAFRELVEERGGSITTNEQGAFKESGTMVNTVTVVIPA